MKILTTFLLTLIVLLLSNCDFSSNKSADGQRLFKKELLDSLPFNLKEYNDSLKIQDSKEGWETYERIDSLGQFVVIDSYEDGFSGFYFFSKEKKMIGKYRPYSGFGSTKYCYNEDYFFSAAIKIIDFDYDTVKVSQTDHQGNLINEKVIKLPFEQKYIRDFSFSGNNLVLTISSFKHEFLIIGLDKELNVIWEYSTNDFIFYDGINANNENSDLIISQKRVMLKLDSKSGKLIWKYDPFDSIDTRKVYKTSLLLNNNYVGLFKFEGVENEKTYEYNYFQCILSIIDIQNGNEIYTEHFNSSKNELLFYIDKYPNINENEFYLQRGDSTWRYIYLNKN